MNYCIIVDGYSAGKQITRELVKRGYKCIHVKSNNAIKKSYALHEAEYYEGSLEFDGSIENLINEIKHITHENQITCVISGSEPGVELTDKLSEALHLPTSNGTKLSQARRNKFEMRKALASANLQVPVFYTSNNLDDIIHWVNTQTVYPIVAKPLNSACTDGVATCMNEEELKNAYYNIMNKVNIMGHKNDEILVESFVYGTEFVVNSVSCNGDHKLVDIWAYRKKYIQGKTFIYDREELVDITSPEYADMIKYVHQALDAVGIKFGPSHAEVMLTKNGPILIEVAARLGGATNIAVSQDCIGFDSVNLTINSYVDHKAFYEIMHRPNKLLKYAMVVDYATEQEGEIVDETITKNISTLPSVRALQIKFKRGEIITPTNDLLSSPVKVHLVHENREQLQVDYEEIQLRCKNGFILKGDKRQEFTSLQNKNSFFSSSNKALEMHETNIDTDECEILLGKINKGWHERAQIRKSESDLSGIEFDPIKEDFIEELLPFYNHELYKDASKEMKSKILTCGWIIYNEKTVAIETQLIAPCCTDIIGGLVPGLTNHVFRESAAEAMIDESFHTLLVLKANEISSAKRGLKLKLPEFELIKQVNAQKTACEFEWQRILISSISAGISELFVSDYLKLMSRDETIQPLNRLTVKAHYLDEIRHSKVFDGYLRCIYASLPSYQKAFFAKTLVKPLYWFADKELSVWQSALKQIGFAHGDQIVNDLSAQDQYNLDILDISKLDRFADSIGLSGTFVNQESSESLSNIYKY